MIHQAQDGVHDITLSTLHIDYHLWRHLRVAAPPLLGLVTESLEVGLQVRSHQGLPLGHQLVEGEEEAILIFPDALLILPLRPESSPEGVLQLHQQA